jgi:2-oxoglutarate dehydrogenase complex dehydrogenase (E1) component-like enzyme
MRETFRAHGFRLAKVNPLRSDQFLSPPENTLEAVPKTLRPLVSPLAKARSVESAKTRNVAERTGDENRAQATDFLDLFGGNSAESHLSLAAEDKEVLDTLLMQYCGAVGFEVSHCATDEERQFFFEKAEQQQAGGNGNGNGNGHGDGSPEGGDTRRWVVEQVVQTEAWEDLLGKRYPLNKRFSLSGMESAVVAVNTLLDELGATNQHADPCCFLGTLHRGRINMLHTVLQLELARLVGKYDVTDGPSYDDITSAMSNDVVTRGGHRVHVSMPPIPAHLEAMDPAIGGLARGEITNRLADDEVNDPAVFDAAARAVLPILLHGDASFCGQGIVAESLQLGTFTQYRHGGSIHIVLNNQVGFTAETSKMRAPGSRNISVTDVALGIRAPVLHVNSRDPLEVARAARIAAEYRQKFGKDIVLNLIGFRKVCLFFVRGGPKIRTL